MRSDEEGAHVMVEDSASGESADLSADAELLSDAELAEFSRLAGRFCALPVDDPVRLRAEQVAASFSRDGRRRRRDGRRQEAVTADRRTVARTALGGLTRREDAPLALPEVAESVGRYVTPRRCYVCKQSFRQVDAFYHLLCPECARDNARRRAARTDLTGRRALVTGGRVKIGFQLALMMLRDGAEVMVTSRFPHDTVCRFRAAAGSAGWMDRLTVLAVDLRDPRQVIGLCDGLVAADEPLDILVNNAAQTVRRPPESYALLSDGEHSPLPPGPGRPIRPAPGFRPMPVLTEAWATAQIEGARATPAVRAGAFTPQQADEAGLLPDFSPANSWSARLGSLDPAELLETHLVNALAPTLLCDRLLPLLLASPRPRRYIVNVTAVEGRFAVRNKTSGHPHTNMAKAALNMLTRTSADDLAARGVYLCAVDTGWITDENPAPKKARLADRGFRTPLDIVDGAARVYDPVVRGEAGDPVWGVFLKDYREAAW
nr:SDR family NAD(P)-dependent oxidoreductase [Actinospica durhamensis]